MDLLTHIRDDLVSRDILLSVVLRKARILAESFDDADFTAWVKFEMNGYPPGSTEVPEYRVLNVPSIGHFAGAFGSGMRNVNLPSLNLPKSVQEFMRKTILYEGVTGLEALLSSESDTLAIKWPANLVVICQEKFYESRNLIDAQKCISKSMISQILESIRSRLLEFVLSLRKKYPDYKTEEALQQIPKEKVKQEFQAHISGSYAVN
jgi:hypothetical protein